MSIIFRKYGPVRHRKYGSVNFHKYGPVRHRKYGSVNSVNMEYHKYGIPVIYVREVLFKPWVAHGKREWEILIILVILKHTCDFKTYL